MIAVSKGTTRIFRNNIGIAHYLNGTTVSYGLCNPGGSDLIGWTTIPITPDMLGKRIAVFTAIEVKTPKGKPTKEQQSFLSAVTQAGGIAGIATSEAEAVTLIQKFSPPA